MKAVILAAGKGTRMLPLTERIPKVLVEVNDRPFLFYLLSNLKEAGFDDIGIVVGYKKDEIIKFLDKNKIRARIIEQAKQLGTGHAALCAQKFVNHENFVLVGGDNLWSVEDLKRMNIDDNYNYLAGYEVPNPEKYGVLETSKISIRNLRVSAYSKYADFRGAQEHAPRFSGAVLDMSKTTSGISVVSKEFLKRIVEKPKNPKSNFINTGLYKFTPEIFKTLKNVKPSSRNEIEIIAAINLLALENKVKVIKLHDFWLDLGCIEDIPKIERFLNERA